MVVHSAAALAEEEGEPERDACGRRDDEQHLGDAAVAGVEQAGVRELAVRVTGGVDDDLPARVGAARDQGRGVHVDGSGAAGSGAAASGLTSPTIGWPARPSVDVTPGRGAPAINR